VAWASALFSGRLETAFRRYPLDLLRAELASIVSSAIDALIQSGTLPEAVRSVRVEISDTKQPEHGDFACNFAMAASKAAGMNPRAIGEALAAALPTDGLIARVDVAGPGFVNFHLRPEAVARHLPKLRAIGVNLAASTPTADPKRINVEFVSVNPNGPITIGSGRGAAFGSTLCNVLAAAGHTVHREYYINDGVNSEQMRLFAESVQAYVENLPFPEKGYKGEYVQDVAKAIGSKLPDVAAYQSGSQTMMIERQRGDLSLFGTDFDTWFSEQSLHDGGIVAKAIEDLQAKGVADTREFRTKLKLGKGGVIEEVEFESQVTDEDDAAGDESTLWLRSTKFADDMDRVLRRRDGRLTYIASDVAYHADKFNRPANADKLITILGPDHHGYIGRLQAVLAALRMPEGTIAKSAEIPTALYATEAEEAACKAALATAKDQLEVVIYQLVRFLKDGKPAPMRKRDGNIYELRDLINEIGKTVAPDSPVEEQQRIGRDVGRFFYLTRSHETAMDFDIDLATKNSDENPVFYVQYAHARICSILEKATEFEGPFNPDLLTHARESALLRKIMDLPWEVGRCAEDFGVHRLTTYAQDLARSFHHFYDACRVIQPEDAELSRARVALCRATADALKSVLNLLGVSAPERM